MNRILVFQVGVLTVISVLGAVFSGVAGFWSAVAGGACYLVPSAVAVLLLKLFKNNPQMQVRAFAWGEALKVMLSLLLMLLVFAFWHKQLVFLPFLFGLFCVSHLVFLVLLRVRDYGR
ncbi:ATP synthase subunit I [Neisseria chenwenguii]|uniref:F0F1 ATP synthase subunit I n=1 Tax=Neisseria chenwenguii TaxID=1853278 RepID=A0A220S0K4_9NEIS|nr:ATP synthase subunit I [Neisseria chenwenguii]ASK26918.1 F0F1 ATP synthase subunit I [Neisseria chenwenguii]ROV56717.1 F0F1 ATP synthase subunit I [Neisseria chenwenguii]